MTHPMKNDAGKKNKQQMEIRLIKCFVNYTMSSVAGSCESDAAGSAFAGGTPLLAQGHNEIHDVSRVVGQTAWTERWRGVVNASSGISHPVKLPSGHLMSVQHTQRRHHMVRDMTSSSTWRCGTQRRDVDINVLFWCSKLVEWLCTCCGEDRVKCKDCKLTVTSYVESPKGKLCAAVCQRLFLIGCLLVKFTE